MDEKNSDFYSVVYQDIYDPYPLSSELPSSENEIPFKQLSGGNPNLVSAERPYSQGMSSEHKTNKSKRSSQSRVFSHISKKSFEF